MRRQSKMVFLKEWRPFDTHQGTMMNAIVTHFRRRHVDTKHNGSVLINSSDKANEIMGLPYTSGSEVAALWADCNTHVYLDADKVYHYWYFAFDERGDQYAVLKDDKENELVLNISL